MPSIVAHVIKLVSRATVKKRPATKAALVTHIRKVFGEPPIPPTLARGVRRERSVGSVRGEWLRVQSPRRVILYLHGGGYIAGKTRTYHNLCSRLAAALHADVLLPDYRLAPEFPFPAALDDALEAYASLRASGWRADQIVIAGDSAGGGLTLGTLLALRDRNEPLPRAAVLISPLADLTFTNPSVDSRDGSDAMLSAHLLRMGEDLYVAKGSDHRHPHASPAFGDYNALPPLFVTVCEDECLRDDAYAVVRRAREAGVPVTLVSRPGLLHVWPIFVPLMREAREDVAKIIAFLETV